MSGKQLLHVEVRTLGLRSEVSFKKAKMRLVGWFHVVVFKSPVRMGRQTQPTFFLIFPSLQLKFQCQPPPLTTIFE